MTLVDEILQAAEDAEILSRIVASMGHAGQVVGLVSRVADLRARARRIQVLWEGTETPRTDWSKGYKAALLDVSRDLANPGIGSKP